MNEYRYHTPEELVFTIPEIRVDIRATYGGSGPTADPSGRNHLIDAKGAQAVAHLIQTAPEMLKMLRRVSAFLPRDVAEDVDALIAKATRKYVQIAEEN